MSIIEKRIKKIERDIDKKQEFLKELEFLRDLEQPLHEILILKERLDKMELEKPFHSVTKRIQKLSKKLIERWLYECHQQEFRVGTPEEAIKVLQETKRELIDFLDSPLDVCSQEKKNSFADCLRRSAEQ
jgi:predicted  nucleic acid-binding Zn-ribbon protein